MASFWDLAKGFIHTKGKDTFGGDSGYINIPGADCVELLSPFVMKIQRITFKSTGDDDMGHLVTYLKFYKDSRSLMFS